MLARKKENCATHSSFSNVSTTKNNLAGKHTISRIELRAIKCQKRRKTCATTCNIVSNRRILNRDCNLLCGSFKRIIHWSIHDQHACNKVPLSTSKPRLKLALHTASKGIATPGISLHEIPSLEACSPCTPPASL